MCGCRSCEEKSQPDLREKLWNNGKLCSVIIPTNDDDDDGDLELDSPASSQPNGLLLNLVSWEVYLAERFVAHHHSSP